jgi:hypothetical protein
MEDKLQHGWKCTKLIEIELCLILFLSGNNSRPYTAILRIALEISLTVIPYSTKYFVRDYVRVACGSVSNITERTQRNGRGNDPLASRLSIMQSICLL